METKFKVGDMVVLTKPKDGLGFYSILERFVGGIFEIYQTEDENNVYYCKKDGLNFWLKGAWLTKVEGGIIEEEPRAKEENQIDWEARRWELASKLFSLTSHEQAISSADNFIEHYKQTLK